MSEATPIRKPLRRPQRPVERLDSLKNPQPRPPPQATRVTNKDCPNKECNAKDSGVEEDGKTICRNCGTVIDELNVVSDLIFGLATGGQHVVHGYHVGAGETHARRGDVLDKNRLYSSREMTKAHGHRYITQIGIALGMQAQLRDAGMHFFQLAIGGFIQGRRIKSVAAVALYIACRVQRETNQYMLIDLADVLQINVFNLGNVYKSLLKHIRLNGASYIVQPINPEDLILRFAQRLEFGKETMQVAKDAVRIVQRMNRDWMTPGRRPAGICGAALILAARMNNFRRTVREVVYVVKVQEQTIFQRLEEFKNTESSGLTVDEFRTIDLERFADPPAYARQKDGKKKRGRKPKHVEFDDDGDNDQPTVISSRALFAMPPPTQNALPTPATTQQQAQLDSQNMPPPPLPIDPSLIDVSTQHLSQSASSPIQTTTERTTATSASNTSTTIPPSETESSITKPSSNPPTKRRRGPKTNKTAPPPLDADPTAPFDADLTAALVDPTHITPTSALQIALLSTSNPTSSPPSPSLPPQHLPKPRPPIPSNPYISDSEFASDPEVSNCLLTPHEIFVKTRIWTHENRDYIRAQSAKLLKQQLAEANGTARVIVRRKRKRRRIGDMSAYFEGDGQGEGERVAKSTPEAMRKMMEKRKFSSKINYDRFEELYTPSSSPRSGVSRDASESRYGGNSPGSGLLLGPSSSSRTTATTAITTRILDENENETEGRREGDDALVDEQVKGSEGIEGGLDDEIDETEDEEEDGDDGDPYGGMGYDSD